MVAARMTGGRVVHVDCPVCGLPLPSVVVDYDARGDGPGSLFVQLEVQELDAAWWDAAREQHPTCVPGDAPTAS
jgi:hypothetical protein